MKDLPPLNPVRAFVAAARHLSICRAADEMRVTPGAVSRQVKVLEEHLGIRLFRRSPSEIALTAEGEQYFRAISPHLDGLAEATRTLVGRKGQDVVRIRAYTTFSVKWLIPRIASFNAQNPDTELRLTTLLDSVDFERENVDAAIRLGDGHFPGLEVDRLFDNELVPLCSPRFAQENNLRQAVDLSRVRLLHAMARPYDWRTWVEAAGVANAVDFHAGPKLASSILTYHAAIEGQGVMLGQKALFREDLERGVLFQPFGPTVSRGDFTFYLVFARNRLRNPAMRRFRTWLVEQCAAEVARATTERFERLLVA